MRQASKRVFGAILVLAALLFTLLWQRRQSSLTPATPGLPGAQVVSAMPPNAGSDARIPMIDMHVHLSKGGVPRLAKLMKQYGFDHIINLSGGAPGGTLEQQLLAAMALPGKITTFTSLDYAQAAHDNYGERMAASLRTAHERGAKGLKVAKVLGLALRAPDGHLIAVDDPKLDPVFELAGELDMPVAIHAGDPRAFWQPVDDQNERADELRAHPGWALYGAPVPSFKEILAQLEHRIARHPHTKFISVHFGNCAEDPDYVARMLRTYPNMYIDTAARIPEIGRQDPQRMRQFYEEFQDRIVFGSDLGVGREGTPLFLGSSGSGPATYEEEHLFFSATHRYFETADRNFPHPTPIQGNWTISGVSLPRSVLQKIYYKNAARLLHIELD